MLFQISFYESFFDELKCVCQYVERNPEIPT